MSDGQSHAKNGSYFPYKPAYPEIDTDKGRYTIEPFEDGIKISLNGKQIYPGSDYRVCGNCKHVGFLKDGFGIESIGCLLTHEYDKSLSDLPCDQWKFNREET